LKKCSEQTNFFLWQDARFSEHFIFFQHFWSHCSQDEQHGAAEDPHDDRLQLIYAAAAAAQVSHFMNHHFGRKKIMCKFLSLVHNI
jgi:hypothetical protein